MQLQSWLLFYWQADLGNIRGTGCDTVFLVRYERRSMRQMTAQPAEKVPRRRRGGYTDAQTCRYRRHGGSIVFRFPRLLARKSA